MWLEAVLTRDDLSSIVDQFAPLEIRLGENGRLLLAGPTKVDLVEGAGISVECDATLNWSVLGIDVPVTMRGLKVLVRPVVETPVEGEVLAFTLQIDHAGVSSLSILDDRAAALVNEELERKNVGLRWNFPKTLTHSFSLPDALLSAEAISLTAQAGTVKVSDSALGLAVSFCTRVTRRAKGAASPAPGAPDDDGAGGAGPAGRESLHEGSAALRATTLQGMALAAFAMAGAFSLGRLSKRTTHGLSLFVRPRR
jgi:hypothetical protein